MLPMLRGRRDAVNMRRNVVLGEDAPMSEEPADLAAVKARLEEIQTRKRGRIRWSISRHTAELALGALADEPSRGRSGKSRRRKRYKRLL